MAASSDTGDCMYEEHISVTITGLDPFVWTEYKLVSTCILKKDRAENYYSQNRIRRGDLFAVRPINTNEPMII